MRWSIAFKGTSPSMASVCGPSKCRVSRTSSASPDWRSRDSPRISRPASRSAGAWPRSTGGEARVCNRSGAPCPRPGVRTTRAAGGGVGRRRGDPPLTGGDGAAQDAPRPGRGFRSPRHTGRPSAAKAGALPSRIARPCDRKVAGKNCLTSFSPSLTTRPLHCIMRKVQVAPVSQAEATRLQPTRRFALVSGAVLVAAALMLSALYHVWADSELEAMAEQNNVAMARVFENHLLHENRDFFTDAGVLNIDRLHTPEG